MSQWSKETLTKLWRSREADRLHANINRNSNYILNEWNHHFKNQLCWRYFRVSSVEFEWQKLCRFETHQIEFRYDFNRKNGKSKNELCWKSFWLQLRWLFFFFLTICYENYGAFVKVTFDQRFCVTLLLSSTTLKFKVNCHFKTPRLKLNLKDELC